MLGKKYILALASLPYLGWSLGTLFGALLGGVLPSLLTGVLSVAIYAMFIAIIIPEAKAHLATAICIFTSIAVSFAFEFIPVFKNFPRGIFIVIATVVISAIFAFISPICENDPWEEEECA
jgi:predicted branched-subunit amino acid permease